MHKQFSATRSDGCRCHFSTLLTTSNFANFVQSFNVCVVTMYFMVYGKHILQRKLAYGDRRRERKRESRGAEERKSGKNVVAFYYAFQISNSSRHTAKQEATTEPFLRNVYKHFSLNYFQTALINVKYSINFVPFLFSFYRLREKERASSSSLQEGRNNSFFLSVLRLFTLSRYILCPADHLPSTPDTPLAHRSLLF